MSSPTSQSQADGASESNHPTESQEVVDPYSLAGQRPYEGALMMVKRTFIYKWPHRVRGSESKVIQPGDLVRVLRPGGVDKSGFSSFYVEHLASGGNALTLPRLCFFSYGEREICACPGYRCRCIYDNFDAFLAFYKSQTKICSVEDRESQAVSVLLRIQQKPPGTSLDN